jgi:hypothetical protein
MAPKQKSILPQTTKQSLPSSFNNNKKKFTLFLLLTIDMLILENGNLSCEPRDLDFLKL